MTTAGALSAGGTTLVAPTGRGQVAVPRADHEQLPAHDQLGAHDLPVDWLDLDRPVPEAELSQLREGVGDWVAQDHTLPDVLDTFGSPSVWIGASSPYAPKTLVYAALDPGHDLVCFHLGTWFAATAPSAGPGGVHAEPVVLAVRHRPGPFHEAFSLTPEGLRRKPSGDQTSPLRSTVWVFHGENARFASGVFDTSDAGLAWAAEHKLTGILAEYATGGAYDVALSEGRFRPEKPHHGTAGHIANFGPGLRHLHVTDGLPD